MKGGHSKLACRPQLLTLCAQKERYNVLFQTSGRRVHHNNMILALTSIFRHGLEQGRASLWLGLIWLLLFFIFIVFLFIKLIISLFDWVEPLASTLEGWKGVGTRQN